MWQCSALWTETMIEIVWKKVKVQCDGWRPSDEEMEGQSDGLQQGRRSHVMASLQRAALCFVVGHVYCTLSHCFCIDREGGHTPDLTTALYLGIALCVCVCVYECTYVCVFGHIYTESQKSPLIMVYGFIIMTRTTV